MRISDWSSDVCSSDLVLPPVDRRLAGHEYQHVSGLPAAEPAITHPRQTHALVSRHQRPGDFGDAVGDIAAQRSEEHTSELQSLMRISYAVFCLKKKTTNTRP